MRVLAAREHVRWLEQCEACTGWVLFTDLRDVYIQRDPFTDLPAAHASAPVVHLFEEYKVTNEHWITASVVNCYGHSAYETYADRPMLNVGTTLGNRVGGLKYMRRLADELRANGV